MALSVPVALLAVLYVTLLITPIPLPFARDTVRAAVLASMPQTSSVELGDMALALEGGYAPVIQFSPVVFNDTKSGARVRTEALEVGFSPVRAIVGQPGVTISIVGPKIQVNQDLFGPRLANLEIIADPQGGQPIVRIIEGQDAFPTAAFEAGGINVEGEVPASGGHMRSDNDWLIYNLEATVTGLGEMVGHARAGRFARLIVRDGYVEMNDAVYGVLRTFEEINLDITANQDTGAVKGTFAATFDGKTMAGGIERTSEDDGSTRIQIDIANMDFAAVLPFINDPAQITGIEGTGAVSIDARFEAGTDKIQRSAFRVDMTGTEIRLDRDHYPIVTSIMQVDWDPASGQFTMDEGEIAIGPTSAKIRGVFVLGLDDQYGPTVGIKMQARDVAIRPYDLGPPEVPFTAMEFQGWSAPLYGATGIDLFRAEKPGAWLETSGRADIVRQGMGFDMAVAGQGITADDLKRLWPYFVAGESREWFVKNVTAGHIETSTMRYNFPVGSVGQNGEEARLPPDSISIDMTGVGVTIKYADDADPIVIEGKTNLWMRDQKVTIAADAATFPTAGGDIYFANAAMVMGGDPGNERLIEISGDVTGGIPAILALAKAQRPDAIDPTKIPIDLDAIDGNVALTLVTTINFDEAGEMSDLDYAINGSITGFGSSAPIQSYTIGDGQLSFAASQEGYRIAGQAKVNGLTADVVVEGAGETPPSLLVSSTLRVADLKAMGFDASEFLSGSVKFVGKPMPDGAFQLAVDITDAALTIKDLGITKAAGVSGILEAEIRQTGTLTQMSRVNLAFGDVKLRGGLDFDSEKGLVSADFDTFALSPGDNVSVALAPISGGYQMRLRGRQFDLKPMLRQFFNLGEGSGGPQATQFTQTIVVDAQLDRALGFYRETAFNVDLDLSLKGTDLLRANLAAQFGEGKSISIATNPGPQGKVMSVAFNDLGTLLRFVNVYANLQGGSGSLVLQTDDSQNADIGKFYMRNFAIVDEAQVASALESQQGSRQFAGSRGSLEFTSGQVDFIRRRDRVEVTEAMLAGETVGGTMKGFIYTDSRQYDLTGTYVPMYSLSSAFQRLPIFGPLLGGREGEGLFGVTFAIRGPLDDPNFQINPLSALVPGAFRGLFEFRAREQPRPE